MRVGVLYLDGADTVFSSAGVGLTTGDTRAQAAALVAWVNAEGGLGGARLEPTYYAEDAASTQSDPDAAQQTACTSLSEDSHVTFVVTNINLTQNAAECFRRRGIPVLDDAAALSPSQSHKMVGSYFAPGDLGRDRLYATLVDSLVETGWLTPTSKVGVYLDDIPASREIVQRVVLPALARHGIPVTSTQMASQDQSAAVMLRFGSDHVDRVIPVETSPLFLMLAAQSQDYHPSYAVHSGYGPGALLETAAPAGQLRNAQGIGFQPWSDIGAGDRGGPVSSAETLCFGIMDRAGQSASGGTVKLFEAQLCDVLFVLKGALHAATARRPADVLTGYAGLGRSYLSPATFASELVRDRGDGAAAYRVLHYDDACSCFQYSGGRRPVSSD